jgi:hypothetical protein
MIEVFVQADIDLYDPVDHGGVAELIDTEVSDGDHVGGEIKDQFFAFSQQIMHPDTADHRFCLFDSILFPARQRTACFLLEVFDDADLSGEGRFDNGSLPFAECRGLQTPEVLYIMEVERFGQLLLCEMAMFSTLFEVFIEMHLAFYLLCSAVIISKAKFKSRTSHFGEIFSSKMPFSFLSLCTKLWPDISKD